MGCWSALRSQSPDLFLQDICRHLSCRYAILILMVDVALVGGHVRNGMFFFTTARQIVICCCTALYDPGCASVTCCCGAPSTKSSAAPTRFADRGPWSDQCHLWSAKPSHHQPAHATCAHDAVHSEFIELAAAGLILQQEFVMPSFVVTDAGSGLTDTAPVRPVPHMEESVPHRTSDTIEHSSNLVDCQRNQLADAV